MLGSAVALCAILVCAGPGAAAGALANAPTARIVAMTRGSRQSLTVATSPNWSGYVAEAPGRFSAVEGTWVQPAVGCSGSARAAVAVWIGLDGFRDETVEQIGVKARCDGGSAVYTGWWQLWPGPVHFLPAVYLVHPSDVMHAAVLRSGRSFTLSLRSSVGWSFATVASAPADRSSAVWIASSPPGCRMCGFAPLANFGRVTFSGAQAADGGPMRPVGSFRAHDEVVSVTMVGPRSAVVAHPSPLSEGGSRFTVTRVGWDNNVRARRGER
jgi:hypothetical protein